MAIGELETKICQLPRCNKIIPEIRAVKGGKTCCDEHAKIYQSNKQAMKRADKRDQETTLCKGHKCNRIVVTAELGASGLCYWCKVDRGMRQTRKKEEELVLLTGNTKKIERDPLVYDSRNKICHRKGLGLCDDYSSCLEAVCLGKSKLKCDVEGIDCWHMTPKATKASYGTQLTGSHVIRFS